VLWQIMLTVMVGLPLEQQHGEDIHRSETFQIPVLPVQSMYVKTNADENVWCVDNEELHHVVLLW
jgi:uncharacterized HAD superfamily protein